MPDASLQQLIAEAQVLAGTAHPCTILGHVWKETGAAPCPCADEDGTGRCGHHMALHECTVCAELDYGQVPGEPGYDYCASRGFNCGGRADPARAQALIEEHERKLARHQA